MRFLVWQAQLVKRIFTPRRVMMLGVIMVDISMLFIPWYPFSGEKFGVYAMSQLALMFAGILCTVEAERMEKEDED